MDLSKLSANEKLAVYGAAAAVIGGLVAALTYRTYSGAWLGVIAGLGMLAIVFLPQQSPGTRLPGSKGTLMLIAGGAAGVILALLFLANIGFTFSAFGVADILWIVGVAGGVVMAWAGWQEFQAEGGKFQLGSASGGTAPSETPAAPAASPPPPASPPPASPPPASPPPTASEPPAHEPPPTTSGDPADHGAAPRDEDRPTG